MSISSPTRTLPPKPDFDDLIAAIEGRELATVESILAVRPELARMNGPGDNEQQALHHAVLTHQPEIVRLLMRHGANPHSGVWPHRDATTPMILARERGADDIVAILQDEQAKRVSSPPPPDQPLRAQLIEAFERGDEDGLIALFEAHPALVHVADPTNGSTPVIAASAFLFARLVGWLLEHGADPRRQTMDGKTALDCAGVMADSQASDWSARRDRIGQQLVRHGAAITPGWMICTGDLEALRELHTHFADAGTPLSAIPPLLSMAVAARRLEVVQFLLDLGYDPDERRRLDRVEDVIETWGEPLREAAILGEVPIARMLLEHGATPQTGVYAASTAMYEAHARKNAEMVALLEAHGGVPTLSDMAYLRLTSRATEALDEQARSNESGRAAGASDVLQGAADTGNVHLVRAALAHIDWPEGDGRWHWMLMRVLGQHAAADRSKYEDCLRAMLERSGPNVRGPYGRTLLHDVAAAWPRSAPMETEDSLGLAAVLLDFGARLDVRERMLQSTPLGWACRWGRVELVRLLLDRGADPVERDAEAWASPRAWAVKNGDARILRMLEG